MHDIEIDPYLIKFSDEDCFHLHGYVNSQNSRDRSAERPTQLHEEPLYDQKIGVWCAVSSERIMELFFYDTINNERYMQNILQPFLMNLVKDNIALHFFNKIQQWLIKPMFLCMQFMKRSMTVINNII